MNARCLPFLLLTILAAATPSRAQQFVPLLSLTNIWRYDQSSTDLGTQWIAPDYDDSAWAQGPALFGVETNVPFPYIPAGFSSFATPLRLTAPGKNEQTITYYFRTQFVLPGTNPPGTTLVAYGYFDDGVVIHLNGSEAGRIRVPSNQNWQTFALPLSMPSEGFVETANLYTHLLVPGTNVVAVEVHQQATNSSDVAFALALGALVPQPLSITAEPRSQTNVAGTTATFSVSVSGTPAYYQWRKDGVDLPAGIQPTLTIPIVSAADAGEYTVRITNALSDLTSAVATLTVTPAADEPHVLHTSVSLLNLTNTIVVAFNTKLAPQSVWASNFTVHVAGTTNRVTVDAVFYNASTITLPESYVVMRVSGPHWNVSGRSNYVTTINGIRSATGLPMATNTQAPLLWPSSFNLLHTNAMWHVHAAALADPGVYGEAWTSPDFVPGPAWIQGRGPFGAGVATPLCTAAFETVLPYQAEPTLFRTTIPWPTNWPTSATIQFNASYEDAMILYLNGTEIYRAGADSGPLVLPYSRTSFPGGRCGSFAVVVKDLRPGTNVLAAATIQSAADTVPDLFFHLAASTSITVPNTVPNPPPVLLGARVAPPQMRLAWDAPEFVLEATTNLLDGPWLVVTNAGSPITNAIQGPKQFFRLRQ